MFKRNSHLGEIVLILILLAITIPIAQKTIIEEKFTEGSFEYNGITTEYIEYENSDVPTILFMHGAGLSASAYFECLEYLNTNYRVIAPNIPPFGWSTIPGDSWDLTDFAEYFNKFIEDQGLKNIILIGHSFGGGISANLANISDEIDYLILIDAVGGISIDMDFGKGYGTLIDGMMKGFKKDISRTLLAVGNNILNLPHVLSDTEQIERIFKKSLGSLYEYNNIDIPVTILWGEFEQDDFDEEAALYLESIIDGADLQFVGGGHDWLYFEPERFYFLVDNLIKNYFDNK